MLKGNHEKMMQLPEEFVQQTHRVMGEQRFDRFLASFDDDPPVSIRLNPKKVGSDSPSPLMTEVHLGGKDTIPWCPLGFYLPERPNFTFDPLLHAGCYYVQEAASMFIHHILGEYVNEKQCGPLAVLDLCAAPGGKSTCSISALPEGSQLWANEPVRQRASILLENITKWGYPGCTVTNNYPHDYVRSGLTFDIVLCDVPCSGEGMFRRDPQTISEWSPQQVEKCWRLQRDIVNDAWQCLRPGGLLIYSTCTFNTKENEENVRWIFETFDADILPVDTRPEWNITGSLLAGFDAPVYRFIPGITRSEGLFVAVMKKRSLNATPSLREEGGRKAPKRKNRENGLGLNILVPVSIGQENEGEAFPLDYPTAIAFLRGEAIRLPDDAPRGQLLVSFMGHSLGVVKNIGSRANNLYPKEWRIKSTHVPQDYSPVI